MSKLLQKILSRWGQHIYLFALIAVVLTSVRLYSGWFTPILNSDNAVHVLMAQDFSFPEDLYYWGQDRRGSFEPALASLILNGLALFGYSASPLFLLSIVQFSLIAIAFFCLSQFLKRRLSKLIFALIWFLPPMWFQSLLMLAQPYYAQLAFLGLGLRGIVRLEKKSIYPAQVSNKISAQSLCLISIIVISFFCALWISDLSAFLLLGLCGHLGVSYLSSRKGSTATKGNHWRFSLRNILEARHGKAFVAIAIWTTICICFLNFAKQNSVVTDSYQVLFTTRHELLTSLSRIVNRLWPILTFRADNFFLSFSLLGLIAVLPSSLRSIWRIERRKGWIEALSSWKIFFLGCSCFLFVFLLVSKWVYLNDTFARYFALPFIVGSLALLMGLEDSPRSYGRPASYVLLLLAFCSTLGFPTYLGPLNVATPVREKLVGFRDLQNSAFIGDYWTAYLICSVAPDVLSCTPHDKSVVRCPDCVDEVLSEDRSRLYLVRNAWFKRFPNEISQFDRRLVRSGSPRTIGGYVLAPYRIDGLTNDVRTP